MVKQQPYLKTWLRHPQSHLFSFSGDEIKKQKRLYRLAVALRRTSRNCFLLTCKEIMISSKISLQIDKQRLLHVKQVETQQFLQTRQQAHNPAKHA
jgi:hypothetical protein